MSDCVAFLNAEIQRLNEQIKSMSEELQKLTTDRELLLKTRRYFSEREDRHQPALFPDEETKLMSDIHVVNGMKVSEALLTIVHRHGRMETSYARAVLLGAGIITNDKPGHRRIWSTLNRLKADGKVQHTESGVYEQPQHEDISDERSDTYADKSTDDLGNLIVRDSEPELSGSQPT